MEALSRRDGDYGEAGAWPHDVCQGLTELVTGDTSLVASPKLLDAWELPKRRSEWRRAYTTFKSHKTLRCSSIGVGAFGMVSCVFHAPTQSRFALKRLSREQVEKKQQQ